MKFTSIERYKIESEENWKEVTENMPFIQFKPDWKVSVIPPYGGAMARFLVILPSGLKKSVYFDEYESLGSFGGNPYWEVYPFEGDVGRCGRDEIDLLIEMISSEDEKEDIQ